MLHKRRTERKPSRRKNATFFRVGKPERYTPDKTSSKFSGGMMAAIVAAFLKGAAR